MTAELVVEDELSETLLKKLCSSANPNLEIGAVRNTSGFGQIKKNLAAFNNLARLKPVIVLTDLDKANCAVELMDEWFSGLMRHPRLTFRVAVREIESWVIADRERFARFLGIQINLVPPYPDQLEDPKKTVLQLAQASPSRSLKKALLPAGRTARIGPGYNDVMSEFVGSKWRAGVARSNSPSLHRAMTAVASVTT
jgi:hypothetical protein